MSLTVSQLLKLPCLRHAKVLAGHRSLDRIVTSISVLEYATPTRRAEAALRQHRVLGKRTGYLPAFAVSRMTWTPSVRTSRG